jgi:hypothetical protein
MGMFRTLETASNLSVLGGYAFVDFEIILNL